MPLGQYLLMEAIGKCRLGRLTAGFLLGAFLDFFPWELYSWSWIFVWSLSDSNSTHQSHVNKLITLYYIYKRAATAIRAAAIPIWLPWAAERIT
jgi:hypothetical protein